MYAMTAAHPTLPIPSYVRVTHTRSGRSVVVRVNDRGPFLHGRVIDLSYVAAWKLGYVEQGSALVEVEALLSDRMLAAGPLLAAIPPQGPERATAAPRVPDAPSVDATRVPVEAGPGADEARPNTQRNRETLEDRIGEDEGRADHRRRGGQKDRLEADGAGLDQRRAQRHAASARRWRMKSTSRIELRTMMPASAMKPIIDVAVKAASNSQMAEHDADQRQRHRRQDHERQFERAELRDDEKIDAEDRHHEGRAHVAEGDVGHLPLAVPQQRRLANRRAAGRDI